MLAYVHNAAIFVFAQATEGGGGGGSSESDSGGGSFLVKPDIGLMVWTLLAFGLTLYLLNKLAFPRIAEALDKRTKAIEDSIDTAERTKVEAEELLAEYRERLKEARGQAEEIVARARKAAEVHERESLEKSRESREELMEQTRRDIEAETRRAIQEIRKEVADLTVQATEKVTRKSLDDADQRRLVEEALNELDFSALSGERN
jgi:F-type H+-transporting ATPase subunit b